MILDAAVTAVNGQSRTSDELTDRSLDVRYEQKMTKNHTVADENVFQVVSAVFSHTGQMMNPLSVSSKSRFVIN